MGDLGIAFFDFSAMGPEFERVRSWLRTDSIVGWQERLLFGAERTLKARISRRLFLTSGAGRQSGPV